MLEDLRYCTQARRIVGETEFHAGVFHADRCSGCREIPLWMRDIVWNSLKADLARATYHLELLAREPN